MEIIYMMTFIYICGAWFSYGAILESVHRTEEEEDSVPVSAFYIALGVIVWPFTLGIMYSVYVSSVELIAKVLKEKGNHE